MRLLILDKLFYIKSLVQMNEYFIRPRCLIHSLLVIIWSKKFIFCSSSETNSDQTIVVKFFPMQEINIVCKKVKSYTSLG